MALPVELDGKERKQLLAKFIQASFVADGMCANVCIHDAVLASNVFVIPQIPLVRGKPLKPLIQKGRMKLRTRKVHVQFWLNEKEAEKFAAKVKRSGLTRSAYLRKIMDDSEIREAPPVDLPRMVMEVRRVGITLNELLRIAQANGLLDVPKLRKALEDNNALNWVILDAYLGPSK
jgi:hypothetical protein